MGQQDVAMSLVSRSTHYCVTINRMVSLAWLDDLSTGSTDGFNDRGHNRRPSVSGLAAQALRRINQSNGHWIWVGHVGRYEYGIWGGWVPAELPRNVAAHRLVWWLKYGSLPEHLHHTCGVKACVNPAHLQAVDIREHRAIHHPPRTHCVNGHLFDEANTYIRPDNGNRQCRACKNEREKVRWRTMAPEKRAREIARAVESRRRRRERENL